MSLEWSAYLRRVVLVTQQKTEQSFWRGFGGRNRHPIGGLGENPPMLLAFLISNKSIANELNPSVLQYII